MSETHAVTLKLENTFRCQATFENVPDAAPLLLDEPAPLGAGSGPNAMDLLAAAIGNCLAASLMFCLKKSRVESSGIEVRVVTSSDRNEAGRLRVSQVAVELRPAFADDPKAARCATLYEDFCTVTQSIRSGFPVNVTIVR
jgi:uncharacterized OsmC-like protein